MARLTKAQRRQLEELRDKLEWALTFLDRPETLVCQKVEWTNNLDYIPRAQAFDAAMANDAQANGVRGAGIKVPGITAINKQIGSPLAGFRWAQEITRRMLEADDRARGVIVDE